MALGIIHNVDVPIELQLISDLPTWDKRAQRATYNMELLIEQPSVTPFLPEIKSDPCVLAVDGKVHDKQVESHYWLPLVQGVIHSKDVPIELQLINDLPTWDQRALRVTYNVELLTEQQKSQLPSYLRSNRTHVYWP